MAAQSTPNYDKMPPLFSLQRLQTTTKYCFSTLNQEQKSAFANAIYRRREKTWSDIKKAGHHGLGFEKIKLHAIKLDVPRFITDDMDHVLAFRFHGMAPMVGYRQKDVFYVLWFDHDYTLYDH